jgi:hypothetical protein
MDRPYRLSGQRREGAAELSFAARQKLTDSEVVMTWSIVLRAFCFAAY